MATVGRLVVQAVRPHAPLIKFPSRRDMPRPNVEEVLKTTGNVSIASSSPMTSPTAKSPPTQISHYRQSGPPDSVATIRELPMKYRRRMLAVEEMEYIQRGGPE